MAGRRPLGPLLRGLPRLDYLPAIGILGPEGAARRPTVRLLAVRSLLEQQTRGRPGSACRVEDKSYPLSKLTPKVPAVIRSHHVVLCNHA